MINFIYVYMKNLISTTFLKSKEEAKIAVTDFHGANKLNDTEFTELMALINEKYPV